MYSSYQSLWNHNNTFHKKKEEVKIENKDHSCKICSKKFNNRQTKWRHEKTCSDSNQQNTNTNNINIQITKDFSPQQTPSVEPNKLFHKYEIPNSNLHVLM